MPCRFRAIRRTAAAAARPRERKPAGSRGCGSARRLPTLALEAIGHVVSRKPWLTSHASYPSPAMLAGIDLGGTQVRAALARSDGNLGASVKTKTPSLGSPQAMVDWAAAEIDKHRGREKVRSITIAAPGPIELKHG